MVYVIIGEDGKIKRFDTLERAVKYMERHKGKYFFIEAFGKSIAISIIESDGKEAIKKKEVVISRFD